MIKLKKGDLELKEAAKFYETGPPIHFVNGQKVGPIILNPGETFIEAQRRMTREYVLNTPGFEKYIKLVEKREEYHRNLSKK